MRKKDKLVMGVGVNDADYPVHKFEIKGGKSRKVWSCPFYVAWTSMIRRCYSEKYQSKHKTYIGCYVCDEWLVFTSFKLWMEKQDWDGNALDKDIIKSGNKCYHPDLCVFVPRQVNTFINQQPLSSGDLPTGVTLKSNGRYQAQCQNQITGKRGYLGYYDTPELAHDAWKREKARICGEMLELGMVSGKIYSSLVNRYL